MPSKDASSTSSSTKKAAAAAAGKARLAPRIIQVNETSKASFYKLMHRGQTERVQFEGTKKIVDDMIKDHLRHVVYVCANLVEARGNSVITMDDVRLALNLLGQNVAGRTKPKPRPKAKAAKGGKVSSSGSSPAGVNAAVKAGVITAASVGKKAPTPAAPAKKTAVSVSAKK